MLRDLVKIEIKHANSRTKFLSKKIKNTIEYLQFVDIFLLFFLNFQQGDWLIY